MSPSGSVPLIDVSLGVPQREGVAPQTLYTHRVHNVLQGVKGITLVVRRVRGGFRGGIFCSAAKLNLADSAGVRRGPARTQADPGGVRGGIVPPWELPDKSTHNLHALSVTPFPCV